MPVANKKTPYKTRTTALTCLLPHRCTNQPEAGKAERAPSGNMNKTPPSSASLKLNLSFTSGILEAQVENTIPRKKK
jgi:hypothetical protein